MSGNGIMCHMQICTLLQRDNDASIPPLSFFTSHMPFLLPNQQCQSTEGYLQNLFARIYLLCCCSWLIAVLWSCDHCLWRGLHVRLCDVYMFVCVCGVVCTLGCVMVVCLCLWRGLHARLCDAYVYVWRRFMYKAPTMTERWWVLTVTWPVCFHRRSLKCGTTTCRGSQYRFTPNQLTQTLWVSCTITVSHTQNHSGIQTNRFFSIIVLHASLLTIWHS